MDILDISLLKALDGEKINMVFVDSDEDFTVEFVENFGDIKYIESDSDDDSVARVYVREVESFGDVKLELTDTFEDIEIFFEN